MKHPVRISAEAEGEMADASRWYDRQRAGLGRDFLRALSRVIDQIQRVPQAGSPVPAVADTAVRRILLRRFPYHVVYLELPDRVQVLAIAHHRRRPRYWMNRISD